MIVKLSAVLECLSNGRCKNVFVNVMSSNHRQIFKFITHLVSMRVATCGKKFAGHHVLCAVKLMQLVHNLKIFPQTFLFKAIF